MAKKGVSKADITELKALAMPPEIVKQTLKTTAILLGHPQEYVKDWKYIKRILGQADFLNQLTRLDIKSIPAEAVMKANEMSKDIEGDQVKKVSAACYGLHSWNRNVIETANAGADAQTSG